jgi:hypothetical protein
MKQREYAAMRMVKEAKERAIEMKNIGLPVLAMKRREYAAMRMVKESRRRRIVEAPWSCTAMGRVNQNTIRFILGPAEKIP